MGKVAMVAFCVGTVAALVMSLNEVNDVQLLALRIVPALQQLQVKEVKDVQPLALTEVKALWFPHVKLCKPARPLKSIEVSVGLLPAAYRTVITPLGVGLLVPAQAQKVREPFAATVIPEPPLARL